MGNNGLINHTLIIISRPIQEKKRNNILVLFSDNILEQRQVQTTSCSQTLISLVLKAGPSFIFTNNWSILFKVTLYVYSSQKSLPFLCLMDKKWPATFFLTKGLTHWQFCQPRCKHHCHVRIIINFVYCSQTLGLLTFQLKQLKIYPSVRAAGKLRVLCKL